MISILTTNIFYGEDHIHSIIKCLSQQTYKDFEWVYIDGHYNKNKMLVENLCQEYNIKDYIHAPSCKAEHVGRTYHWELYNNALLLSNNDLFLRVGIHRWIHPTVIEIAAEKYYNENIFIELPHIESSYDQYGDDINSHLSPSFGSEIETLCSTAGMFSFTKNQMIDINGNNEAALLIYRFEDAELNARLEHARGIRSVRVDNAMFRFKHNKLPKNVIPALEGRNTLSCGGDGCLKNYSASPNHHSEIFNFHNVITSRMFTYRNFDWVACDCCGTISPINFNEYLDYLKKYPISFGPVGVDGKIGRNLKILRDDIDNLNSIEDKIELLQNSHTMAKYLIDINITDEKIKFIKTIKSFCDDNNIFLINNIKNKKNIINIIKNNNQVFILEILEDIYDDLNDIFDNVSNDNIIYISMRHSGDGCRYRSIKWWDEYISSNENIYSDAEASNNLRRIIGDNYNKYLNCFFCIKKRQNLWHF